MRKALFLLTSLMVATSASQAQTVSNEEILQKLQQLEKKVQELEKENRELKKLLYRRTAVVPLRKRTEKVKVGGRVLFRFSQTQDIDENGGKSIFGDYGNGFEVKKARLHVKGELNDNISYAIQIKADKGSQVQLWDAYVKYSFDSIPLSVKMGQFKTPVSMSYLKSGTELWLPERPVAVNKIAPVWREIGVSATYKLFKGVKLTAGVFNGEGWSSSENYNRDKKYLYTLALDATPINNEDLTWRFRLGGEFGTDDSSKMIYTKYGAASVKRHLIDVETALKFKPYNLSLEAGYLYDNPTDGKDSSGKDVSLGNAKGYYAQINYGLPFFPKVHLVGRYSWLDPNDDVDDKYDVDYTTVGFYYLLNGWQAAVRSSYTWANERHGKEIDNNLFVTEFQLLF